MNDGIVSTISMKYPINSNYESEPNKLFNEDEIEKGVWQVMTPINQDHHTVIGHKLMGLDHDNMKLFSRIPLGRQLIINRLESLIRVKS